jgi:predicted ferric reductase
MFCGTVIYFLADEWATSGFRAARGGYIFTKLCFLLSLGAAVALNPQRLFFLIIIVPVMLVLFVVYGLISRWVYTRTQDPRVAALANAIALAWAIAVTFPVVS